MVVARAQRRRLADSPGAPVLESSSVSLELRCIVFWCKCIVRRCSPVGVRKCDTVCVFGVHRPVVQMHRRRPRQWCIRSGVRLRAHRMSSPFLGPLHRVPFPSIALPPCQVLPAKAKLAVESSPAPQPVVQAEWQASIMRILAAHDSVSRRAAMQAVQNAKQQRASAYAAIRCLDHALAMAGIGLNRFTPEEDEVVCKALGKTEVRELVPFEGEWPFDVPVGRVGLKSVIKDTLSGDRRYELSEFMGPRPCLGLCIDQASTGWAAGCFMLQVLKVFYRPHPIQRGLFPGLRDAKHYGASMSNVSHAMQTVGGGGGDRTEPGSTHTVWHSFLGSYIDLRIWSRQRHQGLLDNFGDR